MSKLPAQSTYVPSVKCQPPRLHWTVLLTLSILTWLLFWELWLVVQANWIKKVTGRSRALKWTVANLCALPLLLVVFGFLPPLIIGFLGMPRRYTATATGISTTFSLLSSAQIMTLANAPKLGWLLAAAMSVTTAFIVRAELKANPIDLRLSKVKTFFFGTVYFQYFLEDMPAIEALQKAVLTDSIPATSPKPSQ